MKNLIALAAAMAAGFAVAYAFVSLQKGAALATERALFETETARLHQELEAARNIPARVEYVTVSNPVDAEPAASRLSPEEIIENLRAIRLGSEAERSQGIRQVIFHLGSLAEWGPAAVPAIRAFLLLNEDLDYDVERREDRRREWFQRSSAVTEFLLPPSLRFGLFDVLKQIGGPEAQGVLAEVLGTSGRGAEVAYVARALEELAPGRYRDLALEAAKDLLVNPLAIDQPSRLDEQAREYLWGILIMYNDGSFAQAAQNLLVNEQGRLDRSAMDYLNAVLKDNAVPALYEAYTSGRLQNDRDRVFVADQVLNYAGPNPQANLLLKEIVTDESLDPRMRMLPLLRLVGGDFGPINVEQPSDPMVIQSRIQVVQSLQAEVADERLHAAMNLTARNLQALLTGEPQENPMRALLGGGRRGGGRDTAEEQR